MGLALPLPHSARCMPAACLPVRMLVCSVAAKYGVSEGIGAAVCCTVLNPCSAYTYLHEVPSHQHVANPCAGRRQCSDQWLPLSYSKGTTGVLEGVLVIRGASGTALQCVSGPRICASGTGLAAATSAPGLGSPLPHLHQDWAHPCHIRAGTGLAPATSAPGLDSPRPGLG
jgi:hypothetical protein